MVWRDERWIRFIEDTIDFHKEKGCRDLGRFQAFINGDENKSPNGNEITDKLKSEDDIIYMEYER